MYGNLVETDANDGLERSGVCVEQKAIPAGSP